MIWIASCRAFFLVAHERAVLRQWPFLHEVSDHIGQTTVGQVYVVTRRSSGLVAQAVVKNVVFRRSRFQQVSDDRAVRVVVAKDQLRDVSDVKVVRLTVPRAIAIELAEFNQNRAVARVGQNPVLVVVKVAISYRQVISLGSDPRAVHVGNRCSCEFDVLHSRVNSVDNPNPFAFGILSGGVDHCAPATHPDQSQIARTPLADIARIVSRRVDLNRVPGGGCRNRRAWSGILFSRSNLQRVCASLWSNGAASSHREQPQQNRIFALHSALPFALNRSSIWPRARLTSSQTITIETVG